jgi:hypothetical protein
MCIADPTRRAVRYPAEIREPEVVLTTPPTAVRVVIRLGGSGLALGRSQIAAVFSNTHQNLEDKYGAASAATTQRVQ